MLRKSKLNAVAIPACPIWGLVNFGGPTGVYVGNYVGVSEIHDINEANVTVAFLT